MSTPPLNNELLGYRDTKVMSRRSSDLVLADIHWELRSSEESGVVIPHTKMQNITARRQIDGDFHRNPLLEDALVALRFKVCICLLHRRFHKFAIMRVRLNLEI
jgi:hypothetical protein